MTTINTCKYIRWLTLLLISVNLFGCTVKLVDNFDRASYEEILKIGKLVDRFYGELLENKPDKRAYQKYSSKYVEIETELRYHYMRNKTRPHNEESIQIADNTLDLWLKYKDQHKHKNAYSNGNAKLDRKRFRKMFISALKAEEAKNEFTK